MAKKKVLLMGKAHSGKTSMRSIIFANYLARDTTRLSPTLDVEHHHVRFLGDLVLNLWDCGGQDAFYESYFERDRETIFRSVELLIYVFDIESESPEKDFDHFCGVLEAIEENSPDARIFVLVHKMDLVAEEDREAILEDRKRLIRESCHSCGVDSFVCFGTSIWDETLYKAWSEIVTNLIPNISLLETHLNNFCRMCDADEVVLFERATFLVIAHAQDDEPPRRQQPAAAAAAAASAVASAATAAASSLMGQSPQADPSKEPVSAAAGSPPERTDSFGVDGDDSDHKGGGSVAATASSTAVDVSSAAAAGPAGTSAPSTAPSSAAASPAQSNPHRLSSSSSSQRAYDDTDAAAAAAAASGSAMPVHFKRTPHFDAHRFEKISNIVKQFKLSCGKAQSQFQGMLVSNSRFTAFIDAFTANTYIMVIVSNPANRQAATLLNIANARRHFEKFIPRI